MLVRLIVRVIEVDADFLVRRALPVFEAAVGGWRTGGGRGASEDVERGVRGWIVRLLAGGFELKDALTLPWPVARDYLDAIREAEQGRLYELSLAMRAAQADEKGWRRSVVRGEKQAHNLNANPGRHDHHREHVKEHVPQQLKQR